MRNPNRLTWMSEADEPGRGDFPAPFEMKVLKVKLCDDDHYIVRAHLTQVLDDYLVFLVHGTRSGENDTVLMVEKNSVVSVRPVADDFVWEKGEYVRHFKREETVFEILERLLRRTEVLKRAINTGIEQEGKFPIVIFDEDEEVPTHPSAVANPSATIEVGKEDTFEFDEQENPD